MVLIILLLILAVLLFGSSAVIGAIGTVLGVLVAIAALVTASIMFELEPIHVVIFAAVGAIGMLGIFLSAAWVLDQIFMPPETRKVLKDAKNRERTMKEQKQKEPSESQRRSQEAIKKLGLE